MSIYFASVGVPLFQTIIRVDSEWEVRQKHDFVKTEVIESNVST